MGVKEKGCVYLVSVEVPVGTEEKSYDEDGVMMGVYMLIVMVCVLCISLFAYVFKCV